MKGTNALVVLLWLVGFLVHRADSVLPLVINEIMLHPGRATLNQNTSWFELYNPNEDETIWLKRVAFISTAAVGPPVPIETSIFNLLDELGETTGDTGISKSILEVPPMAFLVVGNNNNTATNGNVTVNVQLAFSMSNKNGSGINSLLVSTYPSETTGITWSNTQSGVNLTFLPGISMAKINATATGDETVSNWEPSTSLVDCNSGATDKATPGKINSYKCPTAAPTTLAPIIAPTMAPAPSRALTKIPTRGPTEAPNTALPTKLPTVWPTKRPNVPTEAKPPSREPVASTKSPTRAPSGALVPPTLKPLSPTPAIAAPAAPIVDQRSTVTPNVAPTPIAIPNDDGSKCSVTCGLVLRGVRAHRTFKILGRERCRERCLLLQSSTAPLRSNWKCGGCP